MHIPIPAGIPARIADHIRSAPATARAHPVRAALAALLILALLSGSVAFAHARSADNFLVPFPPHSADATGFSDLNPGEVFDLGVIVESASRDTPVTFHSISLPRGLQRHLRILHEAASPVAILGRRGWPVPNSVPLDGYLLPPRGYATLILAVAADQPGVFVVGPVTLHAEVPAPLGIPNAIEMTYPMYGVLCIQISEQTCHTGYDAISKWSMQN